ncbi:immunoglobulin-like domain-containing protein [Neobacillus sp. 204]|uniref:immunoglobulin-like domain-containing protein n=1 Tax=Neobacillus sp. 204 TaxID=3383351 RepID=UPI0039797103
MIIGILSVCVVLVIVRLVLRPIFFVNGNNKENIINVINSSDLFKNKESIKILKIIDDKNERIVPFLYDNRPSYIVFYKDKFGNYKFEDSETRSSELSVFPIKFNLNRVIIVSNYYNNVTKLIIKVNGVKILEDEISVPNETASFYKIHNLPKQRDHGYHVEYELYDKEGKPVNKDVF